MHKYHRKTHVYNISNDELYAKTEFYSMATEVKGLKMASSRQKETGKAKNDPEKNP